MVEMVWGNGRFRSTEMVMASVDVLLEKRNQRKARDVEDGVDGPCQPLYMWWARAL